MYDINMKNVKKGKSFFFIFLFAGLFMLGLIIAIFISNLTKSNGLDSETISTKVEPNSRVEIVNGDSMTVYSPVYYYEVDGTEYKCASNSSSNINPGNENKTVYYDSENPSTCMTQYAKSGSYIMLAFALLPVIFIVIAIVKMKKVNKRIKAVGELNKIGKLVKNLPYRLEDTGMSVNGVRIKRPVVDYTLPTGTTITLYGDPRHDRKNADADGMVDLVIDQNNPENYYVDFEINRLTGSLPEDYYKQN